MADGSFKGIGRQGRVIVGGVGAQLGLFLVELDQGLFDQVALELVFRTMRCLMVARAVPVRKRESQVLGKWQDRFVWVGGLTLRRDKRRTA